VQQGGARSTKQRLEAGAEALDGQARQLRKEVWAGVQVVEQMAGQLPVLGVGVGGELVDQVGLAVAELELGQLGVGVPQGGHVLEAHVYHRAAVVLHAAAQHLHRHLPKDETEEDNVSFSQFEQAPILV
jgi:hypothetical protein